MDELNNQKAIEEFLMDIEILEKVESKLTGFNAFETLGIINTEIRHSNVLAWLMTPTENHGLGDMFIKKFIQTLFYKYKEELSKSNLNLLQISLMDYYDLTVRREWRNIDLLAVSEENKLVIVIENKVWADESSHQLRKYFDIINEEFKDYNKVFIFLTPYGTLPSDEENWIAFDYNYIIELLQKAIELKKDEASTPAKLFIEQYLNVLRRYIVGDKELEKICKEIYFKHQKALDLIFEYKPDTYSEITHFAEETIEKEQNVVIKDICTKSFVRFTTQRLDKIISKCSEGWTDTHRILLFELQIIKEKVVLKLIIGPGDDNIRQKLYDIASSNPNVFRGKLAKLTGRWTQIYSREILPKNYIDNYDMDSIYNKIEKELNKLLNGDIKQIEEKIISQLL